MTRESVYEEKFPTETFLLRRRRKTIYANQIEPSNLAFLVRMASDARWFVDFCEQFMQLN